jgi:hypothetical protein
MHSVETKTIKMATQWDKFLMRRVYANTMKTNNVKLGKSAIVSIYVFSFLNKASIPGYR